MPNDVYEPAALEPGTLRVTPIGGLGEIGRNMTSFEIDGKILIVDCGVLFPEEHQPGVDLILPDFSPIRDRLDDVLGVVLTHGHEDHIGAVPYLLKLRQGHPADRLRPDARAHRGEAQGAPHHPVHPARWPRASTNGSARSILKFIAVNHSIPDALAVAIKTDGGRRAAHRRLQDGPAARSTAGSPTCAPSRGSARRASTCSWPTPPTPRSPASPRSERDIGPVLDDVIAKAPRRVIVASFSSHVHRVQQVLDAAHANGRQVALMGRSMVRNMGIAEELGYLKVPDGVLIDVKKAADMPDNKIVYMSTGSQGEPMAALSRMANRDHKIEVGVGDTVILASSLIPGNENAVYRVINGLTKLGANVVHKGNAKVHVSGHATAGELLYVYNILKPKNVLPVHGEYRHLVANAKLAIDSGVPEENTILAEDGTVIDLRDGIARMVGQLDLGYVYVDGSSVGEITEADLKDRRILAEEGFISIIIVVDASTGKVIVGPEIHAKGFAEDESVFDAVKPKIISALAEAAHNGVRDPYALSQAVRRVVGRWVNVSYRRRPMIVPLVIEA